MTFSQNHLSFFQVPNVLIISYFSAFFSFFLRVGALASAGVRRLAFGFTSSSSSVCWYPRPEHRHRTLSLCFRGLLPVLAFAFTLTFVPLLPHRNANSAFLRLHGHPLISGRVTIQSVAILIALHRPFVGRLGLCT
ncbi:hypothetical protein BKA70DRAFT_1307793 [Coprinopsis sp. MPI-PUGE-AT-0042]|nr:hypothetical protein BKA70DRAFT_1307793 [Coprinopsis sp. MPI-PUGE-AT-0042]